MAAIGGPLDEGGVHIWSLDLDLPARVLSLYEDTLSTDERERADRSVNRSARNLFIAGRGGLRSVLASYLGEPAAAVRFVYGDQGKPHVAPELMSSPLHFNLAHSANLAIIAVSRSAPVGVDVEALRAVSSPAALAKRFFSPSEQAALARLKPADQVPGFFQCWTRKEAYLKAIGDGLRASLSQFTVSLEPDAEPRLLALDGGNSPVGAWRLAHLEPAPGFIGAVASPCATLFPRSARWDPAEPARDLG